MILPLVKPGIVIGKQGANVERIRQQLEKKVGKKVHLKIEEIKVPEIDATLVAADLIKGRVDDGSDPPIEYHRKGSAASQMGPADLDRPWLTAARHLHATGVFAAVSPSTLALTRETLQQMRAAGRSISFDTNLRPTLWPSAEVMRQVRLLQPMQRSARGTAPIPFGCSSSTTSW